MSRTLLQAILVNLQEHTIGQIHDDMDEFEVVAILKGVDFTIQELNGYVILFY